jgi:hypothetical protein
VGEAAPILDFLFCHLDRDADMQIVAKEWARFLGATLFLVQSSGYSSELAAMQREEIFVVCTGRSRRTVSS